MLLIGVGITRLGGRDEDEMPEGGTEEDPAPVDPLDLLDPLDPPARGSSASLARTKALLAADPTSAVEVVATPCDRLPPDEDGGVFSGLMEVCAGSSSCCCSRFHLLCKRIAT